MINVRFQILYKINGRIENKKAFIGDDGWMFEKSRTIGTPSIEKQRRKIQKDAEILKKFADKFKGKNISIYLILIPERETVYQKYWEKYYKPKLRLNYGNELNKILGGLSNLFIVDTYPVIKQNMDNELIYWKDDPHLTPAGMNIVLKKLYNDMAELKNIPIFLEEIVVSKKYSHIATIAARLGFPGKTQISYTYPKSYWKDSKYQEIERKRFHKTRVDRFGTSDIAYLHGKSSTPLIHRQLFILAPCYGEPVYDFLKPLYAHSHWMRTHQTNNWGIEGKNYAAKNIQRIFNISTPATIIVVLPTTDFLGILKDILK